MKIHAALLLTALLAAPNLALAQTQNFATSAGQVKITPIYHATARIEAGADTIYIDPAKPAKVVTVFAGVDTEATQRARSFFSDYQPSSPSIALLKDGEVVHFVHRHMIEGRGPQQVAADLVAAFDKHCGASVGA